MPKDSKSKSAGKEKTVEETYKKKSLHQAILDESDAYIGSKDSFLDDIHIFDDSVNRIVKKQIEYTPGLYKIIDEIIVNARDHHIRDSSCDVIKISVDIDNNQISVYNNGNGIPVKIHKEHNIYVPELIAGHLLTSGNYYQKGKIVGGRNGYGLKVTNIYSTEFIVETLDVGERKEYKQVFKNNMFDVGKPKITDVDKKAKPYTRVTFTPDLKRFGLDELSNDFYGLIKKRTYDIAACTSKKCKVYFNDEELSVRTFDDYIKLYYDELPSELVYEELSDRWRIGALYDTYASHQQVSFVNGISTFHGGTHVKYITDQIIKALTDYMKKKNKNINVKPQYIRENLTLFLDCVIEDPSFESQTKELLKKKVSDFGSKCEITEKFIKKLIATGICNEVMKTAENKDNIILNKAGGTKTERMRDIPKLEDAEEAGKRGAILCKLILTEGDSAKKFAVDGVSHVGNKHYGVFPLRGKLLNVRDHQPKDIMKNEEIMNVMKIMGLKIKTDKKGNIVKSNVNINKLRYGGIIILTDADSDGSHIKGLVMNFVHYFWPNLMKVEGFIQAIVTPIIKAFKGKKGHSETKVFNTISSFKEWQESENTKGWTIKYYKGLGTSDRKDAIEVFSDLERRKVNYIWDIEEKIEEYAKETDDEAVDEDTTHECFDALELAFNKKRADDRKEWLQQYNEEEVINYDEELRITYKDFVDRDLKHFSNYDVKRSVPGIDGLKPSQRKIMYGCFINPKMKRGEIKVSQLGGFIAERTEYHHGEVNLYGTIIKMAQNYRGANNVNLLMPNGNFGSFRDKGKDSAAPRYIYTEINYLTHKLFRKEDEKILDYQYEENIKVEPVQYASIIPMILVNGAKGIGTGYSTNIPMYNPEDICKNIIRKLDGKDMKKMDPWYRGFKGTIDRISDTKFESHGVYTNDDKYVTVTELPVGTSIEEYKEFLEKVTVDPKKPKTIQFVEYYKSIPDNNSVNITIKFHGNNLQDFIKKVCLEKKIKMSTSINTTNMYLFNSSGKLTKYDTPEEILEDYYEFRYEMYQKRKKYYTKILENRHALLKYKKMFIEYYQSGKITINKKTTEEDVIKQLEDLKFPRLATNVDNDNNDDEEGGSMKKSYDYLTSMRIFSLTKNRIDELDKELDKVTTELEDYKNITIKELWTREIEEFLELYKKYLREMEEEEKFTGKISDAKGKSKAKAKTSGAKKKES